MNDKWNTYLFFLIMLLFVKTEEYLSAWWFVYLTFACITGVLVLVAHWPSGGDGQ